MPVVINELVFKGTIEATGQETRGEGQREASAAMSGEERAALVAAVVEEVMRALDRAKER